MAKEQGRYNMLAVTAGRLHLYSGNPSETTNPQDFILLGIHGENSVRKQAIMGCEAVAESTVCDLRQAIAGANP